MVDDDSALTLKWLKKSWDDMLCITSSRRHVCWQFEDDGPKAYSLSLL